MMVKGHILGYDIYKQNGQYIKEYRGPTERHGIYSTAVSVIQSYYTPKWHEKLRATIFGKASKRIPYYNVFRE